MGYPLAERLAKEGYRVKGYNRTRSKAEGLAAAGVTLVDHPAELAECDIVFTMVSTADDLWSVLIGTERPLHKSECFAVDPGRAFHNLPGSIGRNPRRLGGSRN